MAFYALSANSGKVGSQVTMASFNVERSGPCGDLALAPLLGHGISSGPTPIFPNWSSAEVKRTHCFKDNMMELGLKMPLVAFSF